MLHNKTIAQKMKFSVKDFFSICDKISSFMRTWSQLLKKALMENFIFCAAYQGYDPGIDAHISIIYFYNSTQSYLIKNSFFFFIQLEQ